MNNAAAQKYSVALFAADGSSVHTAPDFDEPTFLPAGETLREAVDFVLAHSEGFAADIDTNEFAAASVAEALIRSAAGTDRVTIEEARELVARRAARA